MDDILTAEQVAQILQVHQFTVLKFIKQGKLKASKLGRVYRIRRSDVDKFLDDQVEKKEFNSEPESIPKPKQKLQKKSEKTEKPVEVKKSEPEKKIKKIDIVSIKEPKRRNNTNDTDHYVLKLEPK